MGDNTPATYTSKTMLDNSVNNSIPKSSQKVNTQSKKVAKDPHFPANPRHPYR